MLEANNNPWKKESHQSQLFQIQYLFRKCISMETSLLHVPRHLSSYEPLR